jgi:5'/3'-nucleotidase SurE
LTKPHILLTNDDGYGAEGLRVLQAALEDFAAVSIVAPFAEQSGAAQSLTLRRPIVVHAKRERHWAVEGTPADAVIVALHKLLPERPDLVISGINHGANMGENVYYSGTVGAAGSGFASHSGGRNVAVRAKEPTEFCECGADCAFLGGNNFARRVAGSGLVERERTGAVERRRAVYAAI